MLLSKVLCYLEVDDFNGLKSKNHLYGIFCE